jgi:hypothetical protein
MIGKDLAKSGLDLRSPIERTPIESDEIPIRGAQRSELIGLSRVPALQQFLIERADLTLVIRS